MKKLLVLAILGILAVSCTNAKVVKYNKDRLDVIENYLESNRFVNPSKNLDKLKEKGESDYSKQYKSLEKESEKWLEEQK